MTTAPYVQTPPGGAPTGSRKDRIPKGIWQMAFTELWERFSFYGLQGILSFYLLYALDKGGLAIAPAAAAGIVGAYGGSVYLAQLLGAWAGDRLIAPKRMVLIGGIVITAGHIALAALPGLVGLGIGLVLIIIGTGALKTNITTIVGYMLEGAESSRRDAGFSYFYMAINIGAVVGPLSTGLAQNQLGFHYGFGLAAIGMIAALIQYIPSMKQLPERAGQVNNPLPRERRLAPALWLVLGVGAIVIAAATGLLRAENLSSIVTIIALIAAGAYFTVMLTSRKVTTFEKRRVAAFLPLFLLSGIYFGLLFQKFTAISILVTERIDLHIGSWTFPVAWITMVSPLSAVLITPLIAKLWQRLGDRQPKPATKYAIGLIQIGCAYLYLLLISSATGDAMIPLALILLFMCFAGSSEVFIGPIGLALATKIGPKSFEAQMVGLNFLSLALGSSLSGLLGQLFTAIPNSTYFTIVAGTGIALGAVLMLVRRPLNRIIE